jgi:hypothetical protein
MAPLRFIGWVRRSVIGDSIAACPRAQAAVTDRIGIALELLGDPIFTTPAWPLRTVSTSASITCTVSPQPRIGQMLGFHSATPGTRSSSGMKE